MSQGLAVSDLARVGRALHRPECVLCTRAGDVYVSDWRGGVTRIASDGRQTTYLSRDRGVDLKPNGIALLRDGSFLVANLSEDGGVWRLRRDGGLEPFLLEVDGEMLPPANFVALDALARAWVTVSTRRRPRASAYRRDVADGFVVLVDERGARIVADGLGYTNELALAEGSLYVNETFARRVSRFRLSANGELGPRETFTEFGYGTYPDGVCLDAETGLWVTSVVSNRVIRLAPDGAPQVLLEDADPEHVEAVERAFLAGRMEGAHLESAGRSRLGNVSTLAFGGADGRTAYLGCLLNDHLLSFEAPVAGRPPAHWEWR